jgi:DNA invertase Pin-like site-specific DNA recombinase
VERTKAGLAAAKARGRVGGRKRTVTDEQAAEAIRLLRADTPIPEVAKAIGVSKSLIYQRARGEWAPRIAEGGGK